MSRQDRKIRQVQVVSIFLIIPALIFGAYSLGRANSESPLETALEETPLLVPVVSHEHFDRFRVELNFETSPGKTYQNGDMIGVVTALPTLDDGKFVSGETVLAVDDVNVVAMQSEAPLWRDLGFGAEGSDVARLQKFLSKLGLLDMEPDGVVTDATIAAINSFNRSIGSNEDGIFYTSRVIWIGESPATIESYNVGIGTNLRGGEIIFKGPERLENVFVLEPDTRTLSGDFVVDIGGTTVDYQPGSLTLSTQVVHQLSTTLDSFEIETGVVERREALVIKLIPASSVFVDIHGTQCVFRYRNGQYEPVDIRPIGGGVDTVHLARDFSVTEVLANPSAVAGLTCDS